jgi:oxygen-independent coproporphyrinogen-3 oxidase
MVQGLYIHIPFCHKICHYCDFVKLVPRLGMPEAYLDALIQEFDHALPLLSDVCTVYIGGGTPTMLAGDLFARLLEAIQQRLGKKPMQEYTIEANPNDITHELARTMADYGVNRVSLGVQSFAPQLLSFLGRTHDREEVYRAIDILRAAGIANINIDLMYAIPNETLTDLSQDLRLAVQLHPEHISCYSMILETKTILYHEYQQGKFQLVDDETQLEMSDLIDSRLRESGYHRYEISNYALPGKESAHNLIYWNLEEYLGIGMGSHSQYHEERTVNHETFRAYLAAVQKTGSGLSHTEPFEPEMESLMLGLRKTTGIDMTAYEQRFGLDVFSRFPDLKQHLTTGLLEIEEPMLKLTKRGLDLANQVLINLF